MAPDRRRRPTPRRRPSDRRRRAERRHAIVILLAAGLAIVTVAVVMTLGRTPALDPETGCVADQLTPAEHTVLLIDQTDPLTSNQIDYVRRLILAEYARLHPGGKLTIEGITADPGGTGRTFSRCRVRRGSEVLGITDNPEMVQAAFRRTVGDALDRYLNGLQSVPTAERSPILEAVDNVMDDADFGPTVKARRLVIVSDLAQNSDLVSEYRGPGSGLDLDARQRDALSRDMRGVAVRIHYVRRPALEGIQTPEQRRFWTDWFESQGATVKLGWGLQLAEPAAKRS